MNIMTDYFTHDHFKLLQRWQGKKRDPANIEQSQAYESLQQAYAITEAWARAVQQRLFPKGYVRVVRRPLSRSQVFLPYNWAQLYPSLEAPAQLAYTLGIDAELGFVVKIDTVQAQPALRQLYEQIRGPFSSESPIVRVLPIEIGLEQSFKFLVDWSIGALQNFSLSYAEIADKLALPLHKPRAPYNRIYYGPPGTGKTYILQQILKQDYEQTPTALDADEWRIDFITQHMLVFKWWEAIAAALYDLGGQAKVEQIFQHPFIQALVAAKGRAQHVRQTLWGTLQLYSVPDSPIIKLKLRRNPAIFDKTADSIWHLSGDWPEACADVIRLVQSYQAGPQNSQALQRYQFVTFHQSYGYEDFVEGLRPIVDEDSEQQHIRYEIRSGIFKDLCQRARLYPQQRFAMVIDEINRGNLSKIFGELITLIEPDKREGAAHAACVQLPYSRQSFAVPANIDIIATMNSADRSIALIDTALRRRFEFVPMLPDSRDIPGAPLHGLRVHYGEYSLDIPQLLQAINQRLETLYDRDHTIGHAYFTHLAQVTDGEPRFYQLAELFRYRILPLLEEYFFEAWDKIQLVLADNQKNPLDRFIIQHTTDPVVDCTRLFGSDHGLDSYTLPPRYTIQDDAFHNPRAYLGIYQMLG